MQQSMMHLAINTPIRHYRALLQRLLAVKDDSGKLGLPFNDVLLEHLPAKPGVYRIFEARAALNRTVYVGQTKVRTLQQRLKQHRDRSAKGGALLKAWIETSGRHSDGVAYFRELCRVQCVVVDDDVAYTWGLENGRVARSLFEAFAIAVLRPMYNYERWKYVT